MKNIILDRIDALDDSTLQIRFKKEDGGYHRNVLPPGDSLDAQMTFINSHLASMGYTPIDSLSIEEIQNIVKKEQTPEKIIKYREKIKKEA